VLNFLQNAVLPELEYKKSVQKLAQKLSLQDGVLVKPPSKGKLSYSRFYVPHGSFRKRLLEHFHDDPIGGHMGIKNTIERISRKYFWNDLENDVERHVKNCPNCQVNKKLGIARKTGLHPLPISAPWEDVQLDFAEMRPPSAKKGTKVKNIPVLVIVDRFTKAVELVCCKSQKDLEVIKKFKKRVLRRHGHCSTVTSDGGFGKELKNFFKKEGISMHQSRPYRHTTNGLAERKIRSVREYLRSFTSPSSKLKELIADAQFALNCISSSTTLHSPFFLEHLRHPLTKVDLEFSQPVEEDLKKLNLDTHNIPLRPPEVPISEEPSVMESVEDSSDVVPEVETVPEVDQFAILKRVDDKETLDQILQETKDRVDQKQNPSDFSKRFSQLKYKKGDLVIFSKSKDNKTVEDKSSTQTWGIYRVRGYTLGPHAKEAHNLPESVEAVIENPWIGPDSEFVVHHNEIYPYSGQLPKMRALTRLEDHNYLEVTPAKKKVLEMLCKRVGKSLDELSLMDLVGQRVEVRFDGLAKGWWKGTVVDFEPFLGKHWVKYDVADEEGQEYFPQDFFEEGVWRWCNK
jgi:hypothetical protein